MPLLPPPTLMRFFSACVVYGVCVCVCVWQDILPSVAAGSAIAQVSSDPFAFATPSGFVLRWRGGEGSEFKQTLFAVSADGDITALHTTQQDTHAAMRESFCPAAQITAGRYALRRAPFAKATAPEHAGLFVHERASGVTSHLKFTEPAPLPPGSRETLASVACCVMLHVMLL